MAEKTCTSCIFWISCWYRLRLQVLIISDITLLIGCSLVHIKKRWSYLFLLRTWTGSVIILDFIISFLMATSAHRIWILQRWKVWDGQLAQNNTLLRENSFCHLRKHILLSFTECHLACLVNNSINGSHVVILILIGHLLVLELGGCHIKTS